MSVTAYKDVWENSRVTAPTDLSCLALAEHVNENQLRAGGPAECLAEPNHARKDGGCKRITVQRALGALSRALAGLRHRTPPKAKVRVWELLYRLTPCGRLRRR